MLEKVKLLVGMLLLISFQSSSAELNFGKCAPTDESKEIFKTCYEKITSKGPPADPLHAIESAIESQEMVKEFSRCMGTETGVINAQGTTFNMDKAIEFAQTATEDAAVHQKIEELFKKCASENSETDLDGRAICTNKAWMEACEIQS